MRTFARLLPWIVVLIILSLYLQQHFSNNKDEIKQVNHQDIVLERIESLGKIELTKFHFKEIIENKRLSKEYFNFIKLGIDSKIVLICTGEAVGCIDLDKISANDIVETDSLILISLPEPEICYHKLDLEKTRIYSLETSLFIDKNEFIEEAYKVAEREILQAALDSDIILQTKVNAQLVLQPMLEQLTSKKIELDFNLGNLPEEKIKLNHKSF